MKETAYQFCLLCDRWILLGPHSKQVTDPVTSSGCFLVTEDTSQGRRAHTILSGRRLGIKKHHNPPPDLQPEPESIVVHPKPEPEIIALPESQEAADILSEPPTPEPRWTPDEQEFYEVEILRHNTAGSTARLSNENRVFVHNHVAKNTDYPPGSTLWVRLKPAGVDALYDWRAVEIWKETELEPAGSATLADIFKEQL